MSEALTPNLVSLLGKEGLIRLAEKFGGRRLYVPDDIAQDHQISEAIGLERAGKLSRMYGRSYVNVPLARALRATQYREDGDSNGEIATKLGMTERGVELIFERLATQPSKFDRQLSLKL